MSLFKGKAKIKGPNTAWKVAPTPQSCVKTSDLGILDWTSQKLVGTSVSKVNALDDITFKVEITFGDNVLTDCEQDLTVYEIVLTIGDLDYSPTVVNNAFGDKFSVWHSANVRAIKHAADVIDTRYAWFVTDPAGAYNDYVKAKVKVSQKFEDNGFSPEEGNWGLRVENWDPLPRGGTITVTLSLGLITLTAPITGPEEIAAFNAGVRILGPNDTTWRSAVTGQIEVDTGDIGWFDGSAIEHVNNSISATTLINHFKVGDSSSRAEAIAQMSVSGTYMANWHPPQPAHESDGYAKFEANKIVVVEKAGGAYELTTESSP